MPIKIPAYFNFELNGKLHEYQAKTLSSIKEKADGWWEEYQEENCERNHAEETCDIIAYDDDGEEIGREEYELCWIRQPSDREEHSTYWGL